MKLNKIYNKECTAGLKELPEKSIHCCVTSPPYWGLRDYGTDDQLGLEETPQQYVDNMVKLFREVKRVLKDDGTVKVKELVVMPGKGMSYQKHFKRSELWLVSEGECTARLGYVYRHNYATTRVMKRHDHQHIPVGMWHSITNHTNYVCKIIETQYGSECVELDIERDKYS